MLWAPVELTLGLEACRCGLDAENLSKNQYEPFREHMGMYSMAPVKDNAAREINVMVMSSEDVAKGTVASQAEQLDKEKVSQLVLLMPLNGMHAAAGRKT